MKKITTLILLLLSLASYSQTSKYIKQWCKENNTHYPLRSNSEITDENKKEVRQWARKCVRQENKKYIDAFVNNYRSKEYHNMYISSGADWYYYPYYTTYPSLRFYGSSYCYPVIRWCCH